MEQGLISFFDVKDSGFYRLRRGTSDYVEGNLESALQSIYDWLKGRDFDQTIPWDPSKSPLRTQVYCKSIYKDSRSGDFVFVLWKKFGNDSGSINGILAKSKVDDSGKDSHKVATTIAGQDVIYGEPMYYWFIPSIGVIASIKFPNSLCDSDNVFNYIKKCMDLRVPHLRKKESERTVYNQFAGRDVHIKNVTYLSEDGKYHLVFRLHAELKELSINEASLDSLSKKITHLVVRETISAQQSVTKSGIFELFDKVLRNTGNTISQEKQVEIVTEQSLSVDELKSIIKTYNTEFSSDAIWNNIGFKSDGIDGQTKWFDRYVDRKHIKIDPADKKDSYYTAETLMSVLQSDRSSLLDFASITLEEDLVEGNSNVAKG